MLFAEVGALCCVSSQTHESNLKVWYASDTVIDNLENNKTNIRIPAP